MQDRNEYLDTVCSQIRFQAARKSLRGELETHIDDKTEELWEQGEKEAEKKPWQRWETRRRQAKR